MEIIANFFASIIKIFSFQYLLNFIKQIFRIPGSVLLILVNLIPAIGVVYFNWRAVDIILLYWVENVIIGFFNFFKILKAQGVEGNDTGFSVNGRSISTVSGKYLAYFFMMHYGIFTLVHGIFLFAFIGKDFFTDFILQGPNQQMLSSLPGSLLGFFGSVTALFISHAVSYKLNFIGRKEYLVNSPQHYFAAPYARIIITHITIILGAFISDMFGGQAIIIVFILLKTLFDLNFHIRSHTISMSA